MYLLINTAWAERIMIALIDSSQRGNFLLAKMDFKAKWQQAEKLLPAIDQLLKKNKTSLKGLKGIMIVSGPGSFTALRIGIATANTLGYSLKLPMAEIRLSDLKEETDLQEMVEQGSEKLKKQTKFKIVLPHYGQEPKITKSKK